MDNIVTVEIRKDIVARLKPILSKLLVEKTQDATRHQEYARRVECHEISTGIEPETYLDWAKDEERDADTLIATMYALYGEG